MTSSGGCEGRKMASRSERLELPHVANWVEEEEEERPKIVKVPPDQGGAPKELPDWGVANVSDQNTNCA